MTNLRNVHAGVLREVGSHATTREDGTTRRNFLRQTTGLVALPLVIDPMDGWVRRFFPSAVITPQYRTTTLAEWVQRYDGDPKLRAIIEILSQQNKLLSDMVWMEDALPRHHTVTGRSGIPSRILERL